MRRPGAVSKPNCRVERMALALRLPVASAMPPVSSLPVASATPLSSSLPVASATPLSKRTRIFSFESTLVREGLAD